MTPLVALVLAQSLNAQPLYMGADGGWRLRTEQPAAGSAGLTNSELRASPVLVDVYSDGGAGSSGLTNAQMRASPINVLVDGGSINVVQTTSPWVVSGTVTTGGLTDAQLRAVAVPVSLTSTTITGTSAVSAATLPLPTGAATEATVVKLPLAQGSATAGQSGPLSQAAVTSAAPSYTTAQTSPLSLTPQGALRIAIAQHEFVFSTLNATAVQLAASATFTGGCEGVLSQPAYSLLVFSDQPGTFTINSYQDAACLNVTGSQVFTHLANAGLTRSGALNANYVKVTYQNTGAALTTKLAVDMAYGNIAPATQLNNNPVGLAEVNGAVVVSGNGVTGTGSQRVTIASDNTAFTVNAAQSGVWTAQPGNTANTTPWLVTARAVGNAGAVLDAANNGTAPANVLVTGAQLQSGATATVGTAGQVGNLVAGLDHVLYVRPGGPVNWSCFVQAVSATTQCQAAPAAGLKQYVTGVSCSNQAATVQTVDIVFGTGAACVTGITALSHKYQMGTNATTTSPFESDISFATPLQPAAANAICVRPSAATAFGCTLTGYTAP